MSNYVIVGGELYHHGVKGMHWGIRRYQNKDGSLTPAGKKRYADDPGLKKVDSAKADLKAAKREYNKAANRYSNVPTNSNREKALKAKSKFDTYNNSYKRTKLKYDTAKEVERIRNDDIEFKKKSKHRMRLEEQYKSMGMNDDQAQAAANKRIRTEKVLATAAAVTVAACAAYVIRKKLKDKTDGLIKAGDTLQRVEMQNTNGKLHDTFYVAQGKHDSKRYENLLGMVRKNSTGHAYLMKLEASNDIKVASKDRARKAFGELYKNDPEFRNSVKDHVSAHFAGRNKVSNIDNLSDKNIKKMYDNFNSNLPFIRNNGSGADTKFYNKLKNAGYGAIQDINDMKFSGYNAKNPLIVFDNSKGNIMVKSVSEMTGDLNKRGTVELMKATGESTVKRFMTTAGPVSAAALTAKTAQTYRTDPSQEIKNYKAG